MKKAIVLLAAFTVSGALWAQVTDTTTRNTGIPNFGRTILLADSIAKKRINDSLGNRFVTLAGNETITGVKTFTAAPITGSGAAVTINSSFITSSNNNQMYGLDVWPPAVSNPGGYTGTAPMAARFRSSVLVGGTLDALTLRSNEILRGGDATFFFTKSGTANVNHQLTFRANTSTVAGSTLINGTYFFDSVTFSANTNAQGYSQMRLTPVINQTGYTGVTRGLYISPVLNSVSDFRALEINAASGYQIYAGGTGTSYLGGKLGIGVTAPLYPLDVAGHISARPVGATPSNLHTNRGRLCFSGTPTDPNHTIYNNFLNLDGEGVWDGMKVNAGFGYWVRIGNVNGQIPVTALYINNRGKIGINTTANTTYELAVEGTIGARRVKVSAAAWADYVFDTAYRLAPLQEVEKYVQKNKHLPEVPSATEVVKNGVDVGDNQVLLLKKIEELTLYIIEQNKKQEALTRKVEEQGLQIKQLLEQKSTNPNL